MLGISGNIRRSVPHVRKVCTATGTGKAGELTVGEAGFGRMSGRKAPAENPGPAEGGEEGGPGQRRKVGLPGEGGVPAGRVGGQARASRGGGQLRGVWGGGVWGGGVPLGDGTEGNGKAGARTVRLAAPGPVPPPPLTWARSWPSSGPPPRWRTGSSAPGREGGLAPGRRGSRSPRPPRQPWRWTWTRTRRRRPPPRWTWTTRWPGPAWGASAAAASAAAASAAAAETGRPQSLAGRYHPPRLRDHRPPLHVPPWPGRGEGRGGHSNRGDAKRTPRLFPGGGSGGGSTGLLSPPAERASERARSCTQARGLPARSPRARPPAAACCGSRRRDTEWACPSGPGSRGPTQRRGAGPGRARAPLAAQDRGRRAARRAGLSLNSAASARRPALPPRPRRPLGQRKPRFSGARPRPGEGCGESAPWPLRSAEPGRAAVPPRPLSRRGPGPGFLSQDRRRAWWRPSGRPPPRFAPVWGEPRDFESKRPEASNAAPAQLQPTSVPTAPLS